MQLASIQVGSMAADLLERSEPEENDQTNQEAVLVVGPEFPEETFELFCAFYFLQGTRIARFDSTNTWITVHQNPLLEAELLVHAPPPGGWKGIPLPNDTKMVNASVPIVAINYYPFNGGVVAIYSCNSACLFAFVEKIVRWTAKSTSNKVILHS